MADRPDPLNQVAKTRGALAAGAFLVALAVVELAFFWWFVVVPLPNAGNAGVVKNQRVYLLITSLPEIVPGVTWDESHLGLALREFSHVEHLPQRVPIMLGAGLIAAAAVALGRIIARFLKANGSRIEKLAIAYGLGCVVLGIGTQAIGRIGLPSSRVVVLSLVAVVVVEGVWSWNRRRADSDHVASLFGSRLSTAALAVVAGPFLLMMALAAMLPTGDFDAIEYHLEGPKEYFLNGQISFLPHNVYTSMPFGVEMLHLLGMTVSGDWKTGALVGQLLVAGFAFAAMIMVAGTARRLAGSRAAWVAAIVYISTPWIYRLAAIPYVEGPLCYFHAALIWGIVQFWTETRVEKNARLWAVVGLLAGGAFTCKYPSLISAIMPGAVAEGYASFSKKSWKIVAFYVVGVTIATGPWLFKNAIDTGNPVYPLGYRVFGGKHWDDELDAKWSRAHGRRPISAPALMDSIVDVAGRNDWQSPLFVMLAPLALLRRESRKSAVILWGYVVYIFLTWWTLTHRLDRFWLPMSAPAAVLAGIGASWSKSRGWSALLSLVLFVGVFSNLVFDSTKLAAFNQWTGDLNVLAVRVPAETHSLPLALLDASLPKNAKVLLVGQAGVFHVEHSIVYDTVFNHQTFETLIKDRSADEVRRALHQQKITHIYVDWGEIRRYRSPGNYGFTAWITPSVFERLTRDGILEPAPLASSEGIDRLRKAGVKVRENDISKFEQKLYRVR